MKLMIDDADVNKIRHLWEYYPVKGVSTNPSILARYDRNPFEILKEIRTIIGPGADLFVQATANDADGMVDDALRIIKELGINTVVKIPAVPEGFKAIRMLSGKKILTCATVIYNPMQAYLAAASGARWVAPYVNRIDNMGYDGVGITKQIQDILSSGGMSTGILAASFRNSFQVQQLCAYGIEAATCSPEIIEGFVKDPAISKAVADFRKDFDFLVGEGVDMKDC